MIQHATCGLADITLFNMAQNHLTEAVKHLEQSHYDLAFSFFRRSVVASNRLTGFEGGFLEGSDIPETNSLYMNDLGSSLNDLLKAIGKRDEKLDILHAFLLDSDLQETSAIPGESAIPAQNRYQAYLYRQMILGMIASIPNRTLLTEQTVSADAMEDMLNFKFALAAYLDTFIHYQQECLNFFRENGQFPTHGTRRRIQKIRSIAVVF